MTDHTSGPAGQGADPNPFSREGAAPAETPGTPDQPSAQHGSEQHGAEQHKAEQYGTEQYGAGQYGTEQYGAGQGQGPSAESVQGHQGSTALPPAGADPSGSSDPYGYPPADQPPYGQPYSQPSANPYGQPYSQPANPPYDQPPATPYGQPSAAPYGQPDPTPYGQPSANPPYEQPPAYGAPGYDQSGYGVNPYQGGYGYPAYGAAAPEHPSATPALITGIIGLVLSFFCGVGAIVGIAGIALGRRATSEIDADPARYTGRSKANAGFIMGIVGLGILVLWVIGYGAIFASR